MAGDAASLLSPELKRCLTEAGIQKLNALQNEAIPPIYEGHDVLLIAPTAGGKTEAAVLPLLERAARVRQQGVQLIYVAPLRALLNDMEPRISRYAQALGLRTFKWHGDVSRAKKRRSEKDPPEVLLITPESIEVILVGRRSPMKLFGEVQCVLVDEVHYFAGSGRGAQLLCLLSRLEQIADHGIQRVGLSATVGNPDRILTWISREERPGRLVAPSFGDGDKQRVWEVMVTAPGEVAGKLLPKLARPRAAGPSAKKTAPRSIVFCRSRAGTEEISRQLEREAARHKGARFRYRVHHSSVAKGWRELAESEIKLRDADSRAIIATSTLELGIDLGDLDLVAEAGGMGQAASFLQRVGRTGRRPGKQQWFVSISPKPADDVAGRATWSFLKNLAILNLGARGVVEDVEPVPKAFHVLSQQILAITVAKHGFQKGRDLPPLLESAAFADITSAEADGILEHMLEADILRSVPPNYVIGEAGEKRYLRQHALPLFSVFDTPREFTVLDGANEVGTVDAGYILGRETPFDLRLAGRNWRALEVAVESAIVKATPAEEGAPPRWWSTGPGTSRIVVEEVARILDGAPLAGHIELDKAAEDWLAELRASFRLPVHEPGLIFVRQTGEVQCAVGALGGDRVMRTISMWLKARNNLESSRVDAVEVVVRSDSDGPAPVAATDVAASLRVLTNADPETILKSIASVIDDKDTFNKFARCVPPPLRRLHLACVTTDAQAMGSFRVETADPAPSTI